jgi:small ligand-binding sensory domain FIST
MHASADALVEGAATAARAAQAQWSTPSTGAVGLALLVSCVGRKLVMGGRVNEELEAVAKVMGPNVTLAGLYAYAEMGPHGPDASCELHNQTMTITYLAEAQ